MALIIPEGIVQLTFHSTQSQGKHLSTVLAYDTVTPITQANLDSASTTFGAPWTNILSTTSSYLGVRALVGQADGIPTIMESVAGAGAGGRGGAMSPPQVQHLARKGTGLATRKGIGHAFIPDVLEVNVSNTGVLVPAEIALVQAWCDACFAGIRDLPNFADMVLLHADNSAPTVVTTFAAEQLASTLRKRYTR